MNGRACSQRSLSAPPSRVPDSSVGTREQPQPLRPLWHGLIAHALHSIARSAQHYGCVVTPATPPRRVTERRVADRIRRPGLKLDGHPVPDRATRATTGVAGTARLIGSPAGIGATTACCRDALPRHVCHDTARVSRSTGGWGSRAAVVNRSMRRTRLASDRRIRPRRADTPWSVLSISPTAPVTRDDDASIGVRRPRGIRAGGRLLRND